jgi:hypothetical protein
MKVNARFEKFNLFFAATLIGFALSQTSYAGTEGHGADGFTEQDSCTNCGTEPSTSPSFVSIQKAFERGATPKLEQLEGNWKAIINIYSNDELTWNFTGLGSNKATGLDYSGIKNEDGTDYLNLTISAQINDFDNEVTLYYSVQKEQGPYIGQYDSWGSFCMSRYGFKREWIAGEYKVYKSIWTSYACKLVRGRADLMLCSVTPYGNDWRSFQKYTGQVIGYTGFKKVQ